MTPAVQIPNRGTPSRGPQQSHKQADRGGLAGAIRSQEAKYLALGHVHALWPPKDGRIKDFIATPKPNGYESLHTTVFCLDSRLAEIQIRTPEMHQMAEYGVAIGGHIGIDMAKVKARKDAVSNTAMRNIESWLRSMASVTNYQGQARLTLAREIEGGSNRISADTIFINVGGRAVIPPFPASTAFAT